MTYYDMPIEQSKLFLAGTNWNINVNNRIVHSVLMPHKREIFLCKDSDSFVISCPLRIYFTNDHCIRFNDITTKCTIDIDKLTLCNQPIKNIICYEEVEKSQKKKIIVRFK